MKTTKVELTVTDVLNAIQIIDVSMTRGAFKANEATNIGKVFDKLVEFYEANKPEETEADDASNSK